MKSGVKMSNYKNYASIKYVGDITGYMECQICSKKIQEKPRRREKLLKVYEIMKTTKSKPKILLVCKDCNNEVF